MQTISKKILLIDDSRFSRNLLKRYLGDDYQIFEADSGIAGLELFAREKPDLVILDLTMPEMTGIEVLHSLRELDQNTPILIGSADVQTYTQDRVHAMGANGFITKPFTAEVLQSMVTNLLNNGSGIQPYV